MKKITQIVLSVFLLLVSLNVDAFAESKHIDLESQLLIEYPQMLAGEKNHLLMGIKTTGPQTVIEDLKMSLSLGKDIQVDEDYLQGHMPSGIDYVLREESIEFLFDRIEGGHYYEIPLIFSVPNGTVKNNTSYDFTLKTLHKDYPTKDAKASVLVEASSPLKINKDYQGLAEDGLEGTKGIAPGLTGKWTTKASIPKSDFGQMFIQEKSIITIREEYDHETLEFVRVDGEKMPDSQEKGVLIWHFDAPSFLEQASSKDLFSKDFDVIYRVKKDLKLKDKLDGQGAKASLAFVNIAGETLYDEDAGKTSLYPSAEDTPEVEGNWWIPGHFGPSDAFGNHSIDFAAMNTRTTVYEWATLTYAHQIAALEYGEDNRYASYAISYFINDHLILDEIKTPGRFSYRPNSDYGPATYLEEQPIFDVSFYDQDDRLLKTYENIAENKIITREEILEGKNPETHIKKVVYSTQKFVPGMIVDEPDVNPLTGVTDLPTYTFKIAPTWKQDAVDNLYELKNEKMIEVERAYPQNYKETYDFRDGVDFDYIVRSDADNFEKWIGWHILSAPRWAIVTEEEETYIPTVSNTIELLHHKESIVYPGSNILRLTLDNELVSNGAVLPNVISYFVLPQTIEIDFDAIPDGYHVEEIGQQSYDKIYKIEWKNKMFAPRQQISVDLKVHLNSELQTINMAHFAHLSENEAFKVHKVEKPTLQDSLKVSRPQELEDYLKETELVLTKNHYTVLSDYYIHVEKFVKAESDVDFKKSTVMKEAELVTYKLDFTNKKGHRVDRFILMDILPHVGDQGITNFVERGSAFNLTLASPVSVDDRFEVLYSTSKNPSREKLNESVDRDNYLPIEGGENVEWMREDQVQKWDAIYSFMIRLKENDHIAINESFSVEFTAQRDKNQDIVKDDYAHNSFALTANGSPVIEPLQVSVKIEEEQIETPPTETPGKPIETPPVETPKKPVSDSPQESDHVDSSLPQTGQSSFLQISLGLLGIGSLFYIYSKLKKEDE